ncbi:hypothetical protein BSKO_09044 [Bryopsis sp. KO-2023]|nr:hypothetical protein BSKO_09044 [Bryopsis sp. KO-2023]
MGSLYSHSHVLGVSDFTLHNLLWDYDLNSTIGILELVVDVSFAHDIYLNFRTSYYDEEGELIERRVMIARNYFKGWFGVDLMSVLPFDVLLAVSNEDGAATKLLEMSRIIKAVKILRLLKAVKMMKLLRLPQLLDVLERLLGKPMFRLLRFLFAVIILSHWSACFFYYMAYLQPSSRTTWLNKAEMETASNTEKYVTSLYWAFATMTSVGYGDVVAVTINEKFTAIVCMIVGVTVFAYLMGAVTSLLGALNSSQARIAAKKQRVDDFLRARKVPQIMANKIRQFYSYIVDKEVRNDETDIIAGLPNKLRTEVILYLFRETLEKVLYFENKAPKFIAELVMMMKIEFYAPEDFVVVQGEQSTEMYFVGEGTLAIRDYGNIENLPKILYSGENVNVEFKHLGFIHAGSQFGEYACLTMEPRTATVVAHTFVELHSLSRAALQEVMGRWPEYGNEMTHHMMKQSRATKDKKRKEKGAATPRALTITSETPQRSSTIIKPMAVRTPALDSGSIHHRGSRERHGVQMAGGNNASNNRVLSNMDEFFHPMFTSQSDEVFHPHKDR